MPIDDDTSRNEPTDDQTADRPVKPGAFEPPTASTADPAAPRLDAVGPLPERIGRYAILRVLGQGGMGTVYQAQQDTPQRLVALKVIRAGYLTAKMLRRFEYESQLLGRLQHPGIAQVYEAGMVEDEAGRPLPFFAMEYIDGVPLTQFADDRRLGTRERLDLVARICDAVSHAHQKGVIHRDLKPGNIIVDQSGQPKILDFGVARATDSDMQTTTMQTDIGQLVGTVPYMSPEQVSGAPGELDTRSDVYALGVIAYELLSGRLPYDLREKIIHEAVRIIREEEPERLSSVNRTLRGDVETIVGKALEKDKARRYASADSLASDIRCYLADQPISARPASGWYQFQKFTKRNRGLVTGVSLALVLLVAGVVGTTIGLRRAVEAEKLAREEASVSNSVTEFVVGSIQNASPQRRGPSATVAETLLASVGDIETEFAEQPRVRERLHGAFADVYRGLNMYRESIEQLRQSVSLAEEREPRSAQVLSLRARLGGQINEIGDYVAAATELARAADMVESGIAADAGTRADIESTLGAIAHNIGDYALAEHHYLRLLDIETGGGTSLQQSADGDLYVGIAHDLLGRLRIDAGDIGAGEAEVLDALVLKKKARGEQSIVYAASVMTLAHAKHARGEWGDARGLYTRAIETLKAVQQDARAPIVKLADACLDGVNEDDAAGGVPSATPDEARLEGMDGLGRMLVVQLRNRGRILITLGRIDEGLDRIARANKLDELIGGAAVGLSKAHTAKDAARALVGAKRLADAMVWATQAQAAELSAGASDADTRVLLATIKSAIGEHEDAIADAVAAVAERRASVRRGEIPIGEALLAEAAAARAAGNDGARSSSLAREAEAMLTRHLPHTDRRIAEARLLQKQ